MAVDQDIVQKGVDWLATTISMRLNYWAYRNLPPPPVLLVEGQTDQKFIIPYLRRNEVICQVSDGSIGIVKGKKGDESPNAKKTILHLVKGIAQYGDLIKMPPRIKDVRVLGMVDRDYDDAAKLESEKNVFVTDTHDLETLMLSTDEQIWERLQGCTISYEEKMTALFMAYQIGVISELFRYEDCTFQELTSKALKTGYSEFFLEDHRISLRDALRVATEEKSPNSAKFKKRVATLAQNRRIKGHLDGDLCWRQTLEEFASEIPSDIWNVLNGHDVLSLLKNLNDGVALKFSNAAKAQGSGHGLDRSFEMAMIEAYDRPKFRNTRICQQMVEAKIVSEP